MTRWLWITLLLAGCGSTGPVLPERILVPTPVKCIDRAPDKPEITPDATLAGLDDYRYVISLARDRLALRDYSGMLEAALAGCL